MKIVVLNGSPKGEKSVTLQYVAYIQKNFPQHQMKIHHISPEIQKIETNSDYFQTIIESVKSADGVFWSFPLYIALVPAQYKRFIELIFERQATEAFKDKYTAVLTTSIHVFDHLAHNYLNAICDDLNMRYVGFYSAEMYELMVEQRRANLIKFAHTFFNAVSEQAFTRRNYNPVIHQETKYLPTRPVSKINTGNKKIVILTDVLPEQKNLSAMISRAQNCFQDHEVETINLQDVNIKGGCLECYRCGYDNQCVYTGKDQFIEMYQTKLKTADILIFAGTIKDRYLSSRWKLFFDRGFLNSHTPSFAGKQIGFLISGPLRQNFNLRQIIEAYTHWQQADLVDIVTDEYPDSEQIDGLIDLLMTNSIKFARENYIQPMNFLGVGCLKIFRDEIWGKLRFIWQADHRYYKKNGIYKFPQQEYLTRFNNFWIIGLMKIPWLRKEFYKVTQGKMIEPFQKYLR